MRIAYYTTDEVNRFLMRRWTRRVGVRIMTPAPRRLAEACEGPVAIDLDYLPVAIRASWLKRLTAGNGTQPALVHGHNITDMEAAALRKMAVRVCRGRVRKATVCQWLDSATATALV